MASGWLRSFIVKHAEKINGVLGCFDRLILRGHLPLAAPGYFSTWLYSKNPQPTRLPITRSRGFRHA
jgi:hypothetical protein